MRTKALLLGGLLAASVLLNLVLLARRGDPAPAAPPPSPKEDSRELRERLDRSIAELAATKEQLARIEKTATAPTTVAPPAAETQDRVSQFRQRLRLLARNRSGPNHRDPAELARENELKAEFHRLDIDRQQNPGVYGQCMSAALERVLEATQPPLDKLQQEEVAKLLRGATERFAKVEGATTPERLASEMRLEGEVWSELKNLLTQTQYQSAISHPVSWLLTQGSMGGLWENGPGNADNVASSWASSLDASQEQFLSFRGQAQFYMETVRRLELEAAPNGEVWDVLYGAGGYELRARAMQAQADAIKGLLPYLTPDQIAKLRTMTVEEYLVQFPEKK